MSWQKSSFNIEEHKHGLSSRMFLVLGDKRRICGYRGLILMFLPLLLMKGATPRSNSALLHYFSACFSTSDLLRVEATQTEPQRQMLTSDPCCFTRMAVGARQGRGSTPPASPEELPSTQKHPSQWESNATKGQQGHSPLGSPSLSTPVQPHDELRAHLWCFPSLVASPPAQLGTSAQHESGWSNMRLLSKAAVDQ